MYLLFHSIRCQQYGVWDAGCQLPILLMDKSLVISKLSSPQILLPSLSLNWWLSSLVLHFHSLWLNFRIKIYLHVQNVKTTSTAFALRISLGEPTDHQRRNFCFLLQTSTHSASWCWVPGPHSLWSNSCPHSCLYLFISTHHTNTAMTSSYPQPLPFLLWIKQLFSSLRLSFQTAFCAA